MSDLVKRLRECVFEVTEEVSMEKLKRLNSSASEAADSIEKLERELAAEKDLADDLEKVAHGVSWDHPARAAYRKARGL